MNREKLTIRTKDFAHRCVQLAMTLPETNLGKHIDIVKPLLQVAEELTRLFAASGKTASTKN